MALEPDKRFQRVRKLTELTRALAGAASADEVIGRTLKETSSLLATHNVVVAVAGADGRIAIHPSAALRLRAQAKLRTDFDVLDENAIERLRDLLIEDEDSLFVAVPLVINSEVAGVLAVARRAESDRSSDEEEWMLSAIADQAAVSLEKVQSHKARRQREEQFQSLYDSPFIGLVFTSRDGALVDANDAFLALSGHSRDDLSARALRWDAVARSTSSHGQRAPSGPTEALRPFEGELLRKDGHRVEVLLGTTRLAEQECDLSFVIDVSGQKRAEISLRILSETSKALLGASFDYEALFKSIAWLVVPRFADWCAVESVEDGVAIGRHVALENLDSSSVESALEWRRRFPPDPKSKIGVGEVIRSGRSQLHRELHANLLAEYVCDADHPSELRRNGLRSAILAPMLLHGRVVGVLTFIRSSGRRRFTADDLDLAEEIARRAVSAVENARLYHRAQEAVGLRDEFLAVAAHELKTPLATLQLQLDVLRKSIESVCAEDEKAARRLGLATQQVERLTRLIADLVNVSRITAGHMTLHREVFDLCELVRTVAAQFEGQARAFGSALRLELPNDPVRGTWDRIRIEQVIGSLISNALKYGAGKPVRVSVRAESMARLAVKDEGIGIAEEDASRIFDRFERAVSVEHYGGLGLGLFIARQIVEAHGGDIRVSSRPRAGAEFVVQLPMLIGAEQMMTEGRT